jgi:hypothetical protein
VADRTPGERLRVAVHEASHAIMAWKLGRGVELLSIRRGAHLDGVTIFEGVADPDLLVPAMAQTQPWDARMRAEKAIAILLAGHLGEVRWIYPDEEGYDPDDDDVRLATQAAAAAVSTPLLSAYRSDLLSAACREERMSDEDQARLRAGRLTPAGEQFLNWICEEVKLEVRTVQFQELLHEVVPALLAAEVLPGETFLEIVQRADRGYDIAASTR